MRADRSLFCLLWWLPLTALAVEPVIDPHADLLYRQALPLLEKAEAQSNALPLDASPNDQELIRKVQALDQTLQPAVALLQRASLLRHPVAEYRLALHYITYLPADQIAAEACPLLRSSIAQGFAPAALEVVNWCPDLRSTAEYRQALEQVPARNALYAGYYPQPAVRLLCLRERPQGLAMQWGRQRDYQAEVYRLLAGLDPVQRASYVQKAVEINGCQAAQRQVVSNHP
ncbi:sel1 repeat family protein [Pseudomonas sp. zfem002]|uniref:sel1 repeat family protein n=1 Tax=Pseudomonas sp. zfem002 TaxID=3078197 RepID=UPI002929C722|nr:sel1 repeat family protein [Pseudomonas sp. zfem002]MDU9394516.1 sel1 repeat family protein [Pseudomonas sp. zfem002]